MKKLSIIVFLSILGFNISLAQSTSKYDILIEKLNIYKECYQREDYIKMSSFILPSVIKKAGGTDKFVEIMNNMTKTFESMGMRVNMSAIEFGKPEKLHEYNNSIITVVSTILPIEINNKRGTLESSVICFSKNAGKTWYFIEGNDEGRSYIAESTPEIIQELETPSPKLTINGRTLYQRNGKWQK